jgi:4-hydroxybenzoate polyprenyltransferase
MMILQKLKHFLILIRWFHELLGLFPFVVLYFIIRHNLERNGQVNSLSTTDFFVLCFGVQLLMIAGFILNDIVDRDIDKINKPNTHTVDRIISLRSARMLFIITSLLIVLVSVYISCFVFIEWAFICPIVYFFSIGYDLWFKRMALIGNVIMAALAAFVPLVIMFFAKDCLAALNNEKIYVLIWLYALLPFSIIIPRELSLDISDMEGDKACGCRSLPILIGAKRSKVIVTLFISATIVLTVLVMYKYNYLRITFCSMDAMLLFYIYKLRNTETRIEYIRIGRFLWFAMIVGILGATLATVW